MKRIYTLLASMALLMAVGMVKVNAQVVDVCAGNDVVEMHLGNFQYGYVQWQVSEDNEFWSDIDGAVDTVYRFLPERPQYYRAEVRFPNCSDQNYYSQVTYVQTPPRAYAGPDFSIPAGMVARLCGSTLKETEGEWRIIEGENGLIEDASDPTSAFVGEEGEYKLTWTLTNSCGSSTDTVVIRCVRMAYQPNVVYVDETDAILSDSTQLVNGEYVVVFSNPVPDIQEGTILLGYRTPSFLRKVTSFERNGDLFLMQTEQGLLTDVILSGALYIDPIGIADGDKKSSVKYIDHYPTRREMQDNPFLLRDGSIYVIRNMSQGFNEKNDDFEITAEIEDGALSLGVMLNLGMWQEQLDGLIYDEEVRLTPNLRTNISIDENGHLNECYLGLYNATFGHSVNLYIDRPLSTTTIADHGMINSTPLILAGCLVGTIPVTLTLDFPVAYNISAAINGLQLSFASTTHFTNAIEYDNQSHEFIKIHEKQEPENLPGGFELNGTLGLDFQAGVKFSILLAGVTGPYVEWRGTTNPSICTSLTSPYQVNADLNLGFDMDLGWRFHLIKDLLEDDASMNFKLIDHKEHAPNSVKKYLGDNQVYTLGNYLPIPITVDVEGWFGSKLSHARVFFEPEAGSEVTATEVITDLQGKAFTLWKPNRPNGRDQLKVRVFDCHGDLIGGTPVVFHAFSSATDPCLNSNLTVDVYHVEEDRIIPQVSGGREPYMYSTDGESFSIIQPNIHTVPGHNYTFYVRDADGCEAMASYNEPFYDCENSGLALTVAASGNVITATGYFGQEPYEYSIDGINYQSTGLFMPLLDGEYTIYVRDALDCVDTKHVTVSREGNLYVWISEIDGHSGTAEVMTSTGSLADRGVCWSTHHAPTVEDLHVSFGQGTGSFPFTINGLDSGTTYYVRAYALDYSGTSYSEEHCINPSVGLYLPEVVATGVTSITQTSAVGSGNVVYDGGATVTERGICWGTNHNPNISGSHITCGSGIGAFTGMITSLTPNTQYYARAYAINSVGAAYGDEIAFTTGNGGGETHEYVDLGLPSGTLWATCNVGANSPEEYGDYFAWGETQPKDYYDWSSFKYCKGSEFTLTKYCWDSNYGYNGFTDTLTILESGDDAAIVNWGNEWCVPTVEQWEELCQNTNSTWIMQNGVYGRLFVAPNGNSLFMPATGYRRDGELYYEEEGFYWLNTIDIDWETTNSTGLYFNSIQLGIYITRRCLGFSVRPVHSNVDPIGEVPEGAINGLFSVAPDYQVYFSQGNLQYIGSATTPYWKFADHQWDFLGDNGQGSDSPNVDRDLFGWGTSGYNHGAVCYQPWCKSENESDYYAYGSVYYNLCDRTGKADWGYNAISNGGNQEHQWRTLSRSEWEYVIDMRVTPSGARYAKASIGGVNGVVLLPDNWEISIYALENVNQAEVDYDGNVISVTDWEILEQNGAVFLPASGICYDNTIYAESQGGKYWSATVNTFSGWPGTFGYTNEEGYNYLGVDEWGNSRYEGIAVRVVQDVQGQVPPQPSYVPWDFDREGVYYITEESASFWGILSDYGSCFILDKGACWSTSPQPTIEDDYVEGYLSVLDFSVEGSVSGLTPNTTYYLRIFVTDSVQTVYSDDIVFTTLPEGDHTPQVVTTEVTDVTSNSATCWFDVLNDGGSPIFGAGVCYSTHPLPTTGDNTVGCPESGDYVGYLTGLMPNTTYYVRAYAFNVVDLGYGNELTFTTLPNGGGTHEYVDLGLPSGTLWATCNVGANTSNSSGSAFAWGETQTKDYYYWDNYQHCNGSQNTLTKYCNNPELGYNGYTDDLTVLEPIDDAATVNWGDEWCMPTTEQWVELGSYTTYTLVNQNGVDGGLFTAPNGNSIFMPLGEYWASSLWTDNPVFAMIGIIMPDQFDPNDITFRSFGRSVRPVRSSSNLTGEVPQGAINGVFSVGEGHHVYFSQGNLQYQASTNTWKFAENQWDYVGEANNNISPTYDGWIDLFGWGTSGWNSGNVYYQPWDVDDSDGSLYGPLGGFDLTGEYANSDWGQYNPISNGGNEVGLWRVLSRWEWRYLFFERNTVSGIRFAKAQVNGINGVLLFPDDWDEDLFLLYSINQADAGFDNNVISLSDWTNMLQFHGAVFLPAACRRIGTWVYGIGSEGTYWSESCVGSDASADYLLFFEQAVYPESGGLRYLGASVRLVQDAPNGSGSGSGGGGREK